MNCKVFLIMLSLFCAVSLVRAEDEGVPGRTGGGKKTAKDDEGKTAGTRSADKAEPGVNNAIGVLSEKPAGSKIEHLVAVLKMQGRDRTLNLIATGDVAEKLSNLAKEGAKVRVNGEATEDGTGIKVKRVTEADGGDKADKGEKKKKKKDDK